LKAEKQNKNKVLMIGPYSAVGGVSTHIKRVSKILKSDYDFSFIDESPLKKNSSVYNIRSLNVFAYFSNITKADFIHIHSGPWWLRVLHLFTTAFFNKKSIVTFHALRNPTKFQMLVQRICCKKAENIIVVSKEIYVTLGIKKALIRPAFIPPIIENEPVLPNEIQTVLEKAKGKKIIIGNAFKLVLLKNQDLYGLDLLINVAIKIKQENLPYKIFFVIANVDKNDDLYRSYLEIISKENLEKAITLIPYSVSFTRLIQKCDLVVRPTSSDGDALTIREALFLNKPVIASNIVQRPEGTILFENRNSEGLFQKIKETLSNQNVLGKDKNLDVSLDNIKLFYKKIYQI
jgi:glycosyltransferase involved in cell wall biosynthesis